MAVASQLDQKGTDFFEGTIYNSSYSVQLVMMEESTYNPGLDSCSLLSADLWSSYKTDDIKPKLHLSLSGLIKLMLAKLSSSSVQ